MKKRFATIALAGALMISTLTGCGGETMDFTQGEFETALNKGQNLEGKTVELEVKKMIPDGAFGYTIHAGDHMNFVSASNPDVTVGDKLQVKVDKVASVVGSYVISYEIVD